jgi:hypothetical protein
MGLQIKIALVALMQTATAGRMKAIFTLQTRNSGWIPTVMAMATIITLI